MLGILLTDFAQKNGFDAHKDALFPIVATSGILGLTTAVFFILGLIAAAYSSADSALTALTTSFSIDILEIDKKKNEADQEKIRKQIHVLFSLVLITTILIFKYFIANESVIAKIFTFANYTYGPLLGLFAFGILTKRSLNNKWVAFICILAPILCFILEYYQKYLLGGFQIGQELLIINGLFTFLGLWLISSPNTEKK